MMSELETGWILSDGIRGQKTTLPCVTGEKLDSMKLQEIRSDDRGVSPVIGVILMVAVTVILAAVIGGAVLGIGNDAQTERPSANFQGDGAAGANWTIIHNGGDVIDEGLSVRYTSGGSSVTEAWSGPVRAGTTYTTNQTVDGDTTIRVVWSSSDGGQEYVLAQIQVP